MMSKLNTVAKKLAALGTADNQLDVCSSSVPASSTIVALYCLQTH